MLASWGRQLSIIERKQGPALWAEKFGQGPALLLCEGGPGAAGYLRPLGETLADQFMVIHFHQRGVGKSGPADQFDLRDFIDDLEAIRSHFAIDQWSVLGHSWGATLALAYTLTQPNNIDQLIYVSGTGIDPAWHDDYRRNRLEQLGTAKSDYLALAEQAMTATGDQYQMIRSRMQDLVSPTDLGDPRWLPAVNALPMDVSYEANQKAGKDWEDPSHWPDLRGQIARLQPPALFIHGAEDPRPASYSQQVADLMPNAGFKLMTGVGHYPWIENREEFLNLLTETF